MIEAVIIAIHGITDNRNYDTFSLIPRQTTPKTQENVQGDTPRGRITTQRSALSCSKTEGYRIQPSFDAVVIDAGRSYEGSVVRCRFGFSNAGNETLVIRAVEGGCACTAVSVSGTEIQPGARGQIEAALDTSGIESAVNKQVSVETNDVQKPSLVLTIRVTVEPEFKLSERYIDFGVNESGRARTESILIEVVRGSVRPIDARSTDPAFSASIERVRGDGALRFRLVAVQGPLLMRGWHYGNILVRTDSSFLPELRVPVRTVIE
jgi:hypothetical protein